MLYAALAVAAINRVCVPLRVCGSYPSLTCVRWCGQTITRYLFHRFLLEAILAPAAVGVVDVQPDERTLRSLTLVHQVSCNAPRAHAPAVRGGAPNTQAVAATMLCRCECGAA
jgi:hypothetical protein